MGTFFIRPALRGDIPLILKLIKGIAEYEHLLHEVTATETLLEEYIFGKQRVASVVIGFEEEIPVGFALYFFNFSTFIGKPGLYLEDLFVFPEYRGKGYGKALFLEMVKIAHQKGCGRMEWTVLKWNQPSIDFYKSMHATDMDEWSLFRLREQDLRSLMEANNTSEANA